MKGAIPAVFLVIAVQSTPAFADIDVVPGPKNSDVLVDGLEVDLPEVGHASGTKTSNVGRYECQQSPGAKAFGFGCGITDFPGTFSFETDDTSADIERAVREIPMPALRVHVQPTDEVLVNIPTIFYTDPQTLRRTVTLLGHQVHVVARPVAYTWHHGDGTSARTSRPGRPYPAKDVAHRYLDTGEDLRIGVDTSYAVTYSVDGGPRQTLSGTLTAAGPTATIDVTEAAPILTH